MLEDFGRRKTRLRERLIQIFSLATALVVLALIVNMLVHLEDFLSATEGRENLGKTQAEQDLLDHLEVRVLKAGFLQKHLKSRDIYVPGLVLQIVNKSGETFGNFQLRSRFWKGRQSICIGGISVSDFKPGEHWEVLLKCSDLVLSGMVIYGIGLEDARQGLEYELTLEYKRLRIVLQKKKLAFRLLAQ